MGEERREHKRYAVRWRGRVALANRELHEVIIHDISKGGAGIELSFMLACGTPLSIEFFVKYRGEMCRIRAKTVVVFNTMLSNNQGALLGLQFTAINKEDLHVLNNVLHLLEDAGG